MYAVPSLEHRLRGDAIEIRGSCVHPYIDVGAHVMALFVTGDVVTAKKRAFAADAMQAPYTASFPDAADDSMEPVHLESGAYAVVKCIGENFFRGNCRRCGQLWVLLR